MRAAQRDTSGANSRPRVGSDVGSWGSYGRGTGNTVQSAFGQPLVPADGADLARSQSCHWNGRKTCRIARDIANYACETGFGIITSIAIVHAGSADVRCDHHGGHGRRSRRMRDSTAGESQQREHADEAGKEFHWTL